MTEAQNQFILPHDVFRKVDIGRLQNELQIVEAASDRGAPHQNNAPTGASRLLAEICEANQLDMAKTDDRTRLGQALEVIYAKAPVLHISFAADPPLAMITKIVTWVRSEIHPYALITVGLQPNLGAGCVLRTSSKYFDFSLKQHLDGQRQLLIDKLAGTR